MCAAFTVIHIIYNINYMFLSLAQSAENVILFAPSFFYCQFVLPVTNIIMEFKVATCTLYYLSES